MGSGSEGGVRGVDLVRFRNRYTAGRMPRVFTMKRAINHHFLPERAERHMARPRKKASRTIRGMRNLKFFGSVFMASMIPQVYLLIIVSVKWSL